MENQIKARLIFEAQGKPKNKLEESLDNMVEKMKKTQELEVFDVKREPARILKDTDLYSGLVDVGVNTKKFGNLFSVILRFGPSAIIVLEPDNMKVDRAELQLALNDVSQVLHSMANENLARKLQLAQYSAQKKAKK